MPGTPPAIPVAVFLIRLGRQALVAELWSWTIHRTSILEHLGTEGGSEEAGWHGDEGIGESRGVLEGPTRDWHYNTWMS